MDGFDAHRSNSLSTEARNGMHRPISCCIRRRTSYLSASAAEPISRQPALDQLPPSPGMRRCEENSSVDCLFKRSVGIRHFFYTFKLKLIFLLAENKRHDKLISICIQTLILANTRCISSQTGQNGSCLTGRCFQRKQKWVELIG